MSLSRVAPSRGLVLADLLPATGAGVWARDAVLITAYVAAIGVSAQVAVPLPFTPVLITGQTFVVLLGAAALGSTRALVGGSAYLALGVAGLPLFSAGSAASFGYIMGFVVAAAVVGLLAQRGFDRTPVRAATAMVVGNLIIYAFGVPYLAVALGTDLWTALLLGVVPFLVGDAIKIALATALLPATWRLVGRRREA